MLDTCVPKWANEKKINGKQKFQRTSWFVSSSVINSCEVWTGAETSPGHDISRGHVTLSRRICHLTGVYNSTYFCSKLSIRLIGDRSHRRNTSRNLIRTAVYKTTLCLLRFLYISCQSLSVYFCCKLACVASKTRHLFYNIYITTLNSVKFVPWRWGCNSSETLASNVYSERHRPSGSRSIKEHLEFQWIIIITGHSCTHRVCRSRLRPAASYSSQEKGRVS